MGRIETRNRLGLIAVIAVWALISPAFANVDGDFKLKPLRDPFWPVDYYPDAWTQSATTSSQEPVEANSDWVAAEQTIQVTGTSRMGDQTAAIINNQIKGEGDLIEVVYKKRTYKWKVRKVSSNGTISLDRLEANSQAGRFQSGDKK